MENIKMYDIVKFAYEKGYFIITDESNFGCDGLHCETTQYLRNGFYCFGEDGNSFEGTVDEYIQTRGMECIFQSIADTLEDMINYFPEEVYGYLLDIKTICKDKGKIDVYQNTLDYYINKIEEVVDKEFNKE